MASVSKDSDLREQTRPRSWREELVVFLIIAAFIWPVVAVGIVGGYGFLVWMAQLVLGPPGPPH